jgi:hypothetical protein
MPRKEPLVPHVIYPIDEDRPLWDALSVARDARDHRHCAELHLELAHVDIRRRDAKLSELVGAVESRDADTVRACAHSYCAWEHFAQEQVKAAEADRAALTAEQEVER